MLYSENFVLSTHIIKRKTLPPKIYFVLPNFKTLGLLILDIALFQ